MNNRFYKGTEEHPFHLSVGGVLLNESNEVCCHYYKELTSKGLTFRDFRILMRETIHPGEKLEECLARGFKEEFGLEGDIIAYVGSMKAIIPDNIEKTVVYFLARLKEGKTHERSAEDIEMGSTLEWHPIPELIRLMKAQKATQRADTNESEILERVQKILGK
jgi:8-oxo-dGTP pyrophosphatase MutT (NUDIX family)